MRTHIIHSLTNQLVFALINYIKQLQQESLVVNNGMCLHYTNICISGVLIREISIATILANFDNNKCAKLCPNG